ncbi:LuxR C-terminal-related transcriptional regulator [Nocardia aurantia]|uniref:HTH luxR-type domain-containing protein n=1 Tax=Nocardia aurantia TaxID=2585199 RepID=A0A7K0DYE1_9NOCA|nr:LuxR C-terminal-related transcriptional regulator [Nocardia aurantia]MQY30711.1 hypothetical protein [Nocardia aurantia]
MGRYRIPALIARDEQVAEVRRLLADRRIRLLTVTGIAGVGKSKLVDAALDGAAERVVAVDLAEVAEPQRVRAVVADRLGGAGSTPAHPGAEPTILFLDNCDPVARQLADELPELLARCPNLTVVTTSRRALGLYQECLFQVRPLAIAAGPGDRTPSPAAHLLRESIETLFRSATSTLTPAITEEIAAELDGVPLALELAAVAVTRIGAERTLARIRSGQPLPPPPFVDIPSRHSTVADCIQWGITDLDALATDLLLHIAASDVLTDLEEVLLLLSGERRDAIVERLAELVNRSLLEHAVAENGHFTYRMPGLVRAYCRQLLYADAARAQRIRDTRATGVGNLATEIAALLDRPGGRAAALRLTDRWYPDLVTTVEHLLARGELESAVGLIRTLEAVWIERRMLPHTESVLTGLLTAADPQVAAQCRNLLGDWALRSGRFPEAVELLSPAGDPGAARRLALAYHEAGQPERARGLLDTIRPDDAAAPRERELAAVLESLILLDDSHSDDDRRALRDRIAALPDRRDRLGLLTALGRTLLRAGTPHRALEVFRQVLRTPEPAADPMAAVAALDGCARAYRLAGPAYSVPAHRLSAATHWIRIDYALPAPTGRTAMPGSAAGAGDTAVTAVGPVLDLDAAIAYGLTAPPLPAAALDSPVSRLTKRQLEVARLVAEGMTNRMIASRLGIAEWTVVNHLRQVMTKLDCPSRLHVALVITQDAEQTA